MKIHFKSSFYFVLSFIILSSCTITKRVHSRGYHVEWNKKHNSNAQQVDRKLKKEENAERQEKELLLSIEELTNNTIVEESNIKDLEETASTLSIDVTTNNSNELVFSENKKSKYLSEPCDEIILRNGNEISAKVIEIDNSVVKYKKCDNLNGPLYSIEKSKILIIKYTNGTKDVFADNEPTDSDKVKQKSTKRKVNSAAVLSFVFSLAGIPIGLFASMIVGLVLSGVAFILGIIGIIIISIRSDKYKGRGFAVVGLILGLAGVVLVSLFLAMILFI